MTSVDRITGVGKAVLADRPSRIAREIVLTAGSRIVVSADVPSSQNVVKALENLPHGL